MASLFQRTVFSLAALLGANAVLAAEGKASVESSSFGQMPDGSKVTLYTLRNAKGMTAKVTDFGGIITQVNVPDRNGKAANVILGADNLAAYMKGYPAAAATIGRFANRIGNARFELDGKEIKVTVNSGGKHLIHGGKMGFNRVLWTSHALPPSPGKAAVEMSYRSADGEEGFPGNCTVTVTFTLTDANELVLSYAARTDRPTVVNLTNHAYFNLAGGGDILDHQMQLFADRYTLADADLIPTGEIAPVEGTPLDFRQPHQIGERITQLYATTKGYDHNYIINGAVGSLRKAARVADPKSGRVMECWTTQPGVQFYSANFFTGKPDGNGNTLARHAAFCLETQHFPDSPNHPEFPSTVLRPGEEFHATTKYQFTSQ